MDVEVLMDNETQKLNTSAQIAKTKIPKTINTEKITDAVEDRIVNRALSTVDLPGDMT